MANSSTAGTFYIIDSGSTYAAVGFVSSNTASTATNGTNFTTVGFSLFGGQVVYTDGTTLESQFWAKTTAIDGVWSLMWNSDGSNQANSVPVTVKTIAPVVLTS